MYLYDNLVLMLWFVAIITVAIVITTILCIINDLPVGLTIVVSIVSTISWMYRDKFDTA